jgi:hypothetical protein
VEHLCARPAKGRRGGRHAGKWRACRRHGRAPSGGGAECTDRPGVQDWGDWRQQSFALNMVQFSEGPWDAESERTTSSPFGSGPSSCCPPFAHAATSLCRMGQDAVDAGHVSAAKGKSDVAVSTRSTPQHASLATPPIRLRGALGALAWLACAGPLASPWPSKCCREPWRWFISRTTEAEESTRPQLTGCWCPRSIGC